MEVRPCGEDWGWLCEDSLKGLGCAAPQLRESRKKPGPTREAGCHCWGLWEERGCSTKVTSFSMASQPSGHCLHELRELALAATDISDYRSSADHCYSRVSCVQVQLTAPTFQRAFAAQQHQGSHNPVPTAAPASLGVHVTHHHCQGSCDPVPPLPPHTLWVSSMPHHC